MKRNYGYDSGGNIIGQSDEVSARTEAGNPSLPHYSYNASLGGQTDCTVCHIQPGTFMQGFGVRTSVSICYSCHSEAGVGHDKPYRTGHPIYVNVTVDSRHKYPTLGSHTGMGSDTVNTHLLNGRQVVCMTCHNSKQKPNDPARSWEPTTTADNMVYQLQNGGWNYDAYLKPVVYRDTSFWAGPTYLKDRKKYIVPESEYDVYPVQGSVVFHQAQPAEYYVYVTLGNDYLRNANINNQLCKDCHVTGSHKGADCTICHGTHNTANLYNIRQKVGTPSGYKEIEYRNVSGLSGNKGACVVCHTTTMYHNATAILPIQHYDNQQCADCHPHKTGFPSFTTVLRSFVRKLFAFIEGDVAYAGPPAWSGKSPTQLPPGLINHSLPAQAWENGLIRFNASVSIVRKPITTTTTIKDDITYYYHNDHLGTPMFMSDEVGVKVWQREQMPFGEDTLLRGTVTENIRMPGQYFDVETGNNQNWNRDYSDKLGRYLEPDPIGQEDDENIFSYVNQNPLIYYDEEGLKKKIKLKDTWYEEMRCNLKEIQHCKSVCASQGKWSRTCRKTVKHAYINNDIWSKIVPGSLNCDCVNDEDLKCDPYPVNPRFKTHYDEDEQTCNNNAKIGISALGAGYLIYRGARMLPSLYPPLWPTIPANLATP